MNKDIEVWTQEGVYIVGELSRQDLVEVPTLLEQLEKAPVDTKLVFKGGYHRHMVRVEDDVVVYFGEGKTSFTTDGCMFSVDYSEIEKIVE